MSTASDVQPVRSLGANYRKLWSASAVSNLADGIFKVALPLIAIKLTTSPALVAGVAIMANLPWLVFVLIAGVLADRFDRRITMRNVQLLRVVVLSGVVVLAVVDQLSLPILYVVAFVLGMGETLFDTAAQSIMPNVVPREMLSRANSRLYAVETTMNRFVGPPLGGLLMALSVPLALTGGITGYALAALGLAMMAGSFRAEHDGPRQSMASDIREGLAYLLSDRILRTLTMMVTIFNFMGGAVGAIRVLYVVRPGPMGLDELGFGLLMTGLAAGAIIGSASVGRVERRIGRANVLTLSVLASSLGMLVLVVTSHVVVVFAAFIVAGGMGMMWNIVTVSLRQRIVPNRLLGRVNASHRLFSWGAWPIGALLGGLIAEVFGVVTVFFLAGVGTLSMLVFRRILTDEAMDAAEVAGDANAAAADAAAAAADGEISAA